MTQNPWTLHPQEFGTKAGEKICQVINVKDDVDADGQHHFRVQVRSYDQNDQAKIPDENCQWIRCEVDPTNKGGTPYIKPGMIVRAANMSGAPGATMSPYISSVISYTPAGPEKGSQNGPQVASATDTAQPREDGSQQYPYDKYAGPKDPIQNTQTNQSIAPDCSIQNTSQQPRDKALAKKNRFESTDTKYSGALTS